MLKAQKYLKYLNTTFYKNLLLRNFSSTMQVTNNNFDVIAPKIEDLLNSCEFYSIDEEMTGIGIKGLKETPYDTLPERYDIMRQVALKYNMIQFGICTFNKDDKNPDNPKLKASPFNIYTFPSNGTITMSASAIDFNRKHNMDFQKWIYEGVNCANQDDEERYLIEIKNGVSDIKNLLKLNYNSDKQYVNKALNEVKEWYNSTNLKLKPLKLDPFNGYLRLATRQRLIQLYGTNIIIESIGEDKSRHLQIKLNKDHENYIKTQINKKIGLRRIFKAMIASKKPLIIHNGFYDLLFMLAAYYGTLPTDYLSFKLLCNECFPIIYDTKAIVRNHVINHNKYSPMLLNNNNNNDNKTTTTKRFKRTHLGDLFFHCQSEYQYIKDNIDLIDNNLIPKEIILADEFQSYDTDNENAIFHQAGFDAYITGYVYHHLCDIHDIKLHEKLKNLLNIYQHPQLLKIDTKKDIYDILNHPIAYIKKSENPEKILKLKKLSQILNLFQHQEEEEDNHNVNNNDEGLEIVGDNNINIKNQETSENLESSKKESQGLKIKVIDNVHPEYIRVDANLTIYEHDSHLKEQFITQYIEKVQTVLHTFDYTIKPIE